MYLFMYYNFRVSKLHKNQLKTWLFSSFLGNIYGLRILILYGYYISVRQSIVKNGFYMCSIVGLNSLTCEEIMNYDPPPRNKL